MISVHGTAARTPKRRVSAARPSRAGMRPPGPETSAMIHSSILRRLSFLLTFACGAALASAQSAGDLRALLEQRVKDAGSGSVEQALE